MILSTRHIRAKWTSVFALNRLCCRIELQSLQDDVETDLVAIFGAIGQGLLWAVDPHPDALHVMLSHAYRPIRHLSSDLLGGEHPAPHGIVADLGIDQNGAPQVRYSLIQVFGEPCLSR
jgi:hypothetical protein